MQQWYYLQGPDRLGPVSVAKLKYLVATGAIDANTQLLRDGSDKWIAASSVKGLIPAETTNPTQAIPIPVGENSRSWDATNWLMIVLVMVVFASGAGGVTYLLLSTETPPSLALAQNTPLNGIPHAASGEQSQQANPKSIPSQREGMPAADEPKTHNSEPAQGTSSASSATGAAVKFVSNKKAPATKPDPMQGEVAVEITPLGPAYNVDGRENPGIFFSPNGRRVAVIATQGSQQKLIVDGTDGPAYPSILQHSNRGSGEQQGPGVFFSPDSQRVVYVAKKNPEQVCVVLDGREGPVFKSVSNLIFSPDSKRFGYIGYTSNRRECHVIVDGVPSPPFIYVESLEFSADSTRYAAAVRTDNRNGSHIYYDDKLSKSLPYYQPESLTFAPAGSQLGFVLGATSGGPFQSFINGDTESELSYSYIVEYQFNSTGEKTAYIGTELHQKANANKRLPQKSLVFGDQEGPLAEDIKLVTLSPDGKRHAYAAIQGGNTSLLVDGISRGDFHSCSSIVFSPDSQHTACVVYNNGSHFMLKDGDVSPPYSQVTPAVFSADSKRMAYVANLHNEWFVVVDGQPGPKFNSIFKETLKFREDGKLFYKARRHTGDSWVLEQEELGEQVVFSPDGSRIIQSNGRSVTIDGVTGQEYEKVEKFVFSPNSQRTAYTGTYRSIKTYPTSEEEPLAHVVVDGHEESPQRSIKNILFSDDSQHVCYVATKGKYGSEKQQIYVDRWAGPEFDNIWWSDGYRNLQNALHFTEDGTFVFLAIKDKILQRVTVDLKNIISLDQYQRDAIPAEGYAVISELDVPFRGYSRSPLGVVTADGTLLLAYDKGGQYDMGGLCKVPLDGNPATVVHEFQGGSSDGCRPSSLIVSVQGPILGTLDSENAHGNLGGGLFTLDAKGNNYRFVKKWTTEAGGWGAPRLFASGKAGMFYGLTFATAADSGGITVSLDGTTSMESHEQLNRRNRKSLGPFVCVQEQLIGVSRNELYRVQTDFSRYKVLHRFAGAPEDGSGADAAPLVGKDGWLYGLAAGGEHEKGIFYRLQPDGSRYQILKHLDRGTGPIVQGLDGAFYAIREGSSSGFTTGNTPPELVRMTADERPIEVLHTFDRRNQGLRPESQLFVVENGLIGFTREGGRSEKGVLYRFQLSAEPMPAATQAIGQTTNSGSTPVGNSTAEQSPAAMSETERLRLEIARLQDQLKKSEQKMSGDSSPAAISVPSSPPKASSSWVGTRAGEVKEFAGIKFVWCRPGEFLMGSPENEAGRGDDETPHKVILTSGFWLAQTETTRAQWDRVMKTRPGIVASYEDNNPALPIDNISWENGDQWITAMAQQNRLPSGWKWSLPTEAQWEYAARAGTTTPHPGNVDEIAWYTKNAKYSTHPVGTKRPNAWGLYDMHGNVAEWCSDWYGYFDEEPLTDPQVLESPLSNVPETYLRNTRVIKGGSWFNKAEEIRSASRNKEPGYVSHKYLGFRAAIVSRSP